jgi:tRNA(adenine34) deaminase
METVESKHFAFMKRAYELAQYAGERGEVPVGAIIVKNNEIIAEAGNNTRAQRNPIKHAEIVAITRACEYEGNERLTGCSMYVTKEPCTMCAGAIIHARIDSVYIAAPDPKFGACGTVFEICGNESYNHVPDVHFGIMENECSTLLKEFFKARR